MGETMKSGFVWLAVMSSLATQAANQIKHLKASLANLVLAIESKKENFENEVKEARIAL